MYTLVVWADDESMPETIALDAKTISQAKMEADARYPNAYSLVITRAGSRHSLANRWIGEAWSPN